jgi:HPr kinase/phosphorylase
MAYFKDLPASEQKKVFREMAEHDIPCLVISRKTAPPPVMVEIADEFQIPLIRTPLGSKNFVTQATVLLEEMLAPRLSLHGTLLDIRGIGTLLRGKSGVGKSECALALIERNHSLVADDMVDIRLVSEHDLIGRIPDMRWWGFMECRGIGIINIRDLFGIRAVRQEKRIDSIITFTYWKQGMEEERTGLTQHYEEILGVQVPHIEIPVRPGRDMARLVEVAAMVQAQKLSGHDSAKDFNDLLLQKLNSEPLSNP